METLWLLVAVDYFWKLKRFPILYRLGLNTWMCPFLRPGHWAGCESHPWAASQRPYTPRGPSRTHVGSPCWPAPLGYDSNLVRKAGRTSALALTTFSKRAGGGAKKSTSVDGEVLHRHRGSNVSNVDELILTDASRQARHVLGLSVQAEKLWEHAYTSKHQPKSSHWAILTNPHINIALCCYQAKVSRASA